MNTIKKSIVALVAIFAFSAAANAQSLEQRAIQKAEASARQCINDLGYPSNLELVSSAEAYQICDYMNPNPNYFGYKVTVYGRTQCPPNMVCIQVIYPIATVYVSCGGDVTQVDCGVVAE